MSRSMLLGVLCALQMSIALANFTGISYEYVPPPAKSETELFTAILDPVNATGVTLQQFMYHFRHGIYSTAFLTEIYTLGMDTHLFTDLEVAYPSIEDRRVALAVGKLWTMLENMRSINRIALRVAVETAHQYLRLEDKRNVLKDSFFKLQDAVIADRTLRKLYTKEKKMLTKVTLPPLSYAQINLTHYGGSSDRITRKLVWSDPKSFPVIAHARFSQHLETRIDNATAEDYQNVLLAHMLEESARDPELKESAQKAYDEAITEAVNRSFDIIKWKPYDEFDRKLFASLHAAVQSNPKLTEKLAAMKIAYANQSLSDL